MDETSLLNRDSFGKELIKKIFLMFLGYLKYTQLTWIILFSGFLLCLVIFFSPTIFFGNTSLNKETGIIQGLQSSTALKMDIHIDNTVILKAYSWFSLFLYILGSITGRLFKTKINLTLKQKIKIATFTFLVGYGIFLGYILFGPESKTSFLSSALFLIFFISVIEITTVWSLYFCDRMDKIMDVLKKS